MLKKLIFYQPLNYPEKPCILLEIMNMPLGEYRYCQRLEDKINEYISSINLDITLCILQIEKNKQELYRQSDEFAWFTENKFDITKLRNNILLEGICKESLLKSYELFEPIYRQQLENIYHFLKTEYNIDEYFRKKYNYECLSQKYTCKNKDTLNKI